MSVHDTIDTTNLVVDAEEQFATLDGDENGYLTQDEFESEGMYGEDRYASFDVDENDMVTIEEVIAQLALRQSVAASQIEVHVHDQGDALFHALDVDHDGRLSEREVTTVEQRIAALDTSDDGVLEGDEVPTQLTMLIIRGALEANQATGLPLAAPPPAPSPHAPAWFTQGDFNRDGDISRQEFLGAPEKFGEIDFDRDGFISPEEAARIGK